MYHSFKMRNLDFSDDENPTFKSWKWMISDEENEGEEEMDNEDEDFI